MDRDETVQVNFSRKLLEDEMAQIQAVGKFIMARGHVFVILVSCEL